MTALAFLDTETTGLYEHAGHEVWEVGLILRDAAGDEAEYLWQLPVDLGRADPMSLAIGRFHERRWPARNTEAAIYGRWDRRPSVAKGRFDWEHLPRWAEEFMSLTEGAHLVGAVPSFDERFLAPLLRRHGACPSWHYHLIDVEALAVGYIAGDPGVNFGDEGRPPLGESGLHQPPWKSDELAQALGIVISEEEKHTALGDARWARAIYDRVMG